MNCSCPKCNAQIEIDSATIPPEGLFSNCPECGTSFVATRESFAKRALYKSDEISCAECGSHPGPSIYCQNCHAIYPDFVTVKTSSAAKKQLGKLLRSFNILKAIKINFPSKASTQRDFGAIPAVTGKKKGLRLPSQPAQLAATLAGLILLLGGSGYYWYQDKVTTEYVDSYIRALFIIKSAKDAEMAVSLRLTTGLKTGISPALSVAEKKTTDGAKSDTEITVTKMRKAPAKFQASGESLKKLHESYLKLHAVITSPGGTAEGYAAAVKRADEEFISSARLLKGSLPEKLADRLAESKKKNKQLADF